MSEVRVYSVGTNMTNFGGAQKVLVDVHNGIKMHLEARILGVWNFEEINSNYDIKRSEYVKFTNPFILRNAVVLIHARKLTSLFYMLNKILFLNMKLIYVAHNVYSEKRWCTFLPKFIISISDKVTHNLLSYFHVKSDRIFKIHNGVIDKKKNDNAEQDSKSDGIKILYAARITDVKRQVEIVRNLKGKLPADLQILFAGTGPLYEQLQESINGDPQFITLGFVSDIDSLVNKYQYMMLFSTKEGLPISLMEGAMHGKPLIVNDVGGNLEVGIPGRNAFLAKDWAELIRVLNNLPGPNSESYQIYSTESRKIYERFFSYDLMISKYLKVITNISQYGKLPKS